MEIDFQLHQDLLGKKLVLGKELGLLYGHDKQEALENNAHIYLETAKRLDYSAITVHPPAIECSPGYIPPWSYPEMEDHLYVIRRVNSLAEEAFYVAMGIDGTYAIPDGDAYLNFVYDLIDHPEEKKEEARKRVAGAVEVMKRMIDAGARVLYNCSDYCFNKGPFLSPALFEEFIYPYLKWQTERLKEEGAIVIKHTDGNILPIMDMLVDAGPHVLHSIDPVAGMDIQQIMNEYGDRICIMGNTDTTVLQHGTREQIQKCAINALQAGMKHQGGYIFSSCNSIFEGIPLENYLAMLEVREFTGYSNQKEEE